jgi:hypothetical protein
MDRSEMALLAVVGSDTTKRYVLDVLSSNPIGKYSTVDEILQILELWNQAKYFGATAKQQKSSLRRCLARDDSGFFERASNCRRALYRISNQHWEVAVKRCQAMGYAFEVSHVRVSHEAK